MTQFHHPQSHLLFHILCCTTVARRRLFGNLYAYLHPVYCFLEAQCLHVARIIVGVPDGVHGARQVEVLYQHTLLVEVGDAHRTLKGVHAQLPSPLLYGFQQGTADAQIVDEFYQTEPYHPPLPSLVGLVIHKTCDAPYGNIAVIGHEKLDIAKFQSGIVFLI